MVGHKLGIRALTRVFKGHPADKKSRKVRGCHANCCHHESRASIDQRPVWLQTRSAARQSAALNLLAFSPKKSAVLIKKVFESAIANAEHNDGADIDELKVKSIYVDKAVVMRRFAAAQRPRRTPAQANLSHSRDRRELEVRMGQKINPTGFRLR